ncbi:MAG: dockerin type I repeat-containing protein [Planctomycetota bacterium]
MNVPPPNDQPEPKLPPVLQAALRDAQPTLPEVPPTLDQAIVNDSRRYLRLKFAPRNYALKIGLPLAAAAAIAFAFVLYLVNDYAEQLSGLSPASPAAKQTPAHPHPHDLNADGTRDILDAFALAQHLKNPTQHPHLANADPNADGQTNADDVDFLAQHAVALR